MIKNPSTPKQPGEVDAYVGKRIRDFRKSMKISQDRLAEQLGITFQQVQKYEKGSNRIGAGRLFQISRIFGVPVASFFPEASAPVSGFAEGGQAAFVADAGGSQGGEAAELAGIFARIDDPTVRTRILDLVRALAVGVETGGGAERRRS